MANPRNSLALSCAVSNSSLTSSWRWLLLIYPRHLSLKSTDAGPNQDDQTYSAMKACDPNGPVMMYVSKMVPSTEGQFIAFGRVISGPLTSRILEANYTPHSPTHWKNPRCRIYV
eukprot:gene11414-13303_t